jgi:arginase family enzyme
MIILGVGIGVLLVVTVGLAVARKVARDSTNFLVAERSQALPLANSPLYASGTFPVVLGGHQSIGYPTTRRRRCHLGCGNLGIIPFDRHVNTLETDFDERISPHRGSTLRTSPTCPRRTSSRSGSVPGRRRVLT